ncbi:MAG: hypothetical protein EXR62_11370 [Chloroflexi bacterium]|nr:hypothetical protein [Chloroflexota bacterium]
MLNKNRQSGVQHLGLAFRLSMFLLGSLMLLLPASIQTLSAPRATPAQNHAALAMATQAVHIVPQGQVQQALLAANCTAHVVDYDIVYVRAPRYGDNANSLWPDTVRPLVPDPGADLRLLHPDCTEELLFPRPEYQALVDAPIGHGSVADPNISFDGHWVVFTYYHDRTDNNPQRCAGGYGDACLSYDGADIYRLNLVTREVVRLTHQEFTPNTGNGANFNCAQAYTNCPNVGVFNVGPAFVAQADRSRPDIVFTSTRNNFLPPKAFNSAERALQLFIMDWNGKNVTQIGYLNNSQALHPFQLVDGRLMFTSWEDQGMRDSRQFNLWFIAPDGTQWNSGSGLGENAIGHHFMTQMSNGDIVTVRYYNLNNNGFGDLARYPVDPPGPDFGAITTGYMPFQRPGQVDLTNWASHAYDLGDDFPAPCTLGGDIYNERGITCPGGNINRAGKVTHPAVAPGDALLLVYTPGPANHNALNVNAPFYDGGIYLMSSTLAANGLALPADLVRILNDPAYNEQWPRPVVAYSVLFAGHDQPAVWAEYQNSGSAAHGLPPNTPLGLIGASSLIWRDTNPRPGPYDPDPDPFNASHEFLSSWVHQGADAGIYTANDIYAVRLLALLPATDRSYPNNGPEFYNVGTERLRILGEIPVRHEGTLDGNSDTDTSFLARIPADTPFTFQTLDRNGMVLNFAQTWHQVRPGEVRYDCGGCHAHSKTPLDFATTVAGQPGFTPTDLALQTPLLHLAQLGGNPGTVTATTTFSTVEYFRDIQPILQQRCSGCHLNNIDDGHLNLHADGAPVTCGSQQWPGTYYRLAIDNHAGCPSYGLGTPAGTETYFLEPQLTRTMRAFQSRQSLLIWKVFGARLDGRTDASRSGDIDYNPASDTIHPNLDSLRGLTWDEKLALARWVDLGAPINLAANGDAWGWFEDDLRPTLWVGPTQAQARSGAVSNIVIGAYDLESGLAPNTLHVSFNVPIGNQAAGTNFAAGMNPIDGGVITVSLPAAIDLVAQQAVITATIQDRAGHLTQIIRTFTPAPQVCYDFNNNRMTDADDISTVAGHWRQTGGLPYDVDGDGRVTVADIMQVSARLSRTCP